MSSPTLRAALLATETNTHPVLASAGDLVAYVCAADAGDTVRVAAAGGDLLIASHPGERICEVAWTGSGRHILYRHAERGREVWALTVHELATGRSTTLADGSVSEFWIAGETIVYSARPAGTRLLALYRLEANESAPRLHAAPGTERHRWLVDRRLRPRGGLTLTRSGATLSVCPPDADTTLDVDIPSDALADLTLLGFDAAGERLFLISSADAPTRQLIALDTVSGAGKVVFADDAWDVASFPIGPDGAWCHPRTGEPDLCSVFAWRPRAVPLTPDLARAYADLRSAVSGEPVILDRSADDDVWLIGVVHDNGPLEYVRYDRTTASAQLLFVNRPDLEGHSLPELTPVRYTGSDGMNLEGYRLAPASTAGPAPTVVLVHGGPASRDLWRFHADAQYLADLGYASLHLNYRGSTGRGRDFRLAGHGQWGGRMQDDLYDGLEHAVAAGLVDPTAVCFWGASYGGYAALLAATTRPDLVRGAIAISPQCDLAGLTTRPVPFWAPIADRLARQVLGDVDADEAERLVRERSPIHRLTARCPPLLVAHGVRDPRIPITEVDAFVARARELDVPVTYLRFDDEGHHVQSNQNRHLLFREIESFLERHVQV